MTSDTTNPARGEAAGLGNVVHGQAIDDPRNITTPRTPKTHPAMTAARHFVEEMVASGAVFTILRREGRQDSFVYELRPGADRARCRNIVADVKASGSTSGFTAAIAKLEEQRR